MEITYTTKAKDDLARINWRIREKIISKLSDFSETPPSKKRFKRIHGSDLVKTSYQKYVIVGETRGRELNVLSVLREQKIKPTGTRMIES